MEAALSSFFYPLVLLVMGTLIAAVGYFLKRQNDEQRESMVRIEAKLELVRQELTAAMSGYVLHAPHMEKHTAIDGRLNSLTVRLSEAERRINTLEQ